MSRGDWMGAARCVGADAALFNPSGLSESERSPRVQAARALCACCPVAQQCLDHALSVWLEGVAGGYLLRNQNKTRAASRQEDHNVGTCGTEAAQMRHRRRGETCLVCDHRVTARHSGARQGVLVL